MTTKEVTKPRTHTGDVFVKLPPSKKGDAEYTSKTKSTRLPSSNGTSPPDMQPNLNGRFSPIAIQPNAPDVRQYVSEAEYWEKYYRSIHGNYEWNNGYLEEKGMADLKKFRLYFWFLLLVKDYLFVNDFGDMVGLEMGFRLNLTNKVTIRKPDLGVVLRSNQTPIKEDDRTYKGIFDICLESVSDSTPGEIRRDTVVKKAEYAQAGVPEYYILDDTGSETVFYRLGPSGVYVPIHPVNGVIQSTIMPGFQFRLEDLYKRPRLATLAMDPVYSAYASPEYREARREVEEAQQQAKEAQQQADEAQQLADEAQKRIKKAEQQAEKAQLQADEAQLQVDKAQQRIEKAEKQARLQAEEARQQIEKAEQQADEAEKARQQIEEELRKAKEWAEQLRTAGIVPSGLDA